MNKKDLQRARRIQAEITKLQHRLTDALLQATQGQQKISIRELEIAVSRLNRAIGKNPLKASRRPIDTF